MRLIDADVLLEKVQEIRKLALDRAVETPANMPFPIYQNPAHTRYSTQADEREKFKVMIEEAPSVQPEQRWIPCSERQPDKEGDYLVTLCDDGRTWVEIALWNETFGGRWQAVLYNDVDYSDISNVIAWMPLPEYYQEKDGEQE